MKRTNRNMPDIMDIITERKMKCIIIVCIFICLFCEFLPDVIDVCELFTYSKIVVFLQPHKDFFTNIALGCLGSAVISYLMLHIQIKVKENDKKENLDMCFRTIISEYYIIFYILKNIEAYEDMNSIKVNIKETNNSIKMNIKSLLNSNANLKNAAQSNELYEIIIHKILPITDVIEVYFDALEIYNYEEIANKKCYKEDFYLILMREIYKKLYVFLDKEYSLEKLNSKIDKLSISLNIPFNMFDNTMEKIEVISATQKTIILSLTFSNLINETFHNISKSYYSE